MNFKEFFSKLKNSMTSNQNNKDNNDKNAGKKITNLLIVVLVGIMLMIVGSSFNVSKKTSNFQADSKMVSSQNNSNQNNSSKTNSNDKDYETYLQNELKENLERIQGVGKVDVMIYFEKGEEKVPAINIKNSNSVTNEKDTAGGTRRTLQNNDDKDVVVTNEDGVNKPLIIRKDKPEITGILVVAEGAEDKVTQLRISNAVCTLFNISSCKVNVYPMKH